MKSWTGLPVSMYDLWSDKILSIEKGRVYVEIDIYIWI